MIFTLINSIACENYTGLQSAALNIQISQDIVINKCQFIKVGTSSGPGPITLYGSSGGSAANITTNYFESCKGNRGSSFALSGNYNPYLYRNAIYKASMGDSQDSVIGYIETNASIPYTLSYLSAFQCATGSRQLNLQGQPTVTSINISSCSASSGKIRSYASGNLYFETQKSFKVTYSTLENNVSPCGVIYLYNCNNALFQKCNIFSNYANSYGLVYVENSKALDFRACTFFKNSLTGCVLLQTKGSSSKITVISCSFDEVTTSGTVVLTQNTATNDAATNDLAFYATGKIFAKRTYVPTAISNGNKGTQGAEAAQDSTAQKGKDETNVFNTLLYTCIVVLVAFIGYIVFVNFFCAKSKRSHEDYSYSENEANAGILE